MIIPFRPPFRLLPFIKPSTTPHRPATQSLLATNAPHPPLFHIRPASPTPVPRMNGAPVTLLRGPARTRTLAPGMTWVNGGNLPVHTMATRKLLVRRPRPPYKNISTARTMRRVWCTKRGSEQPTTMAIIVHRRPDEYVDTLSLLTYFPFTTFHKQPSRRQPPRGRHVRAQSPPLDSPEPETTAPVSREPTEAELRLASSDLSDCEDIWYTEIGYYMLETRRRRRMIEDFFESNLAVSSFLIHLEK